MHTAIVILNWNTVGYLKRFLPGLINSIQGEDAEIIVADNASSDGSLAMLKEHFPDIRTIPLDRNYGFTGGYNKALEQIEADIFILINSDIEVSEGWLAPIVNTMQAYPELGACAPKLHSWYEKDQFEYAGAAGGYIDRFGFPFCRGRVMSFVEKDYGQYDNNDDLFWVSGACFAIRSGLFRKLGGFDNRFFAHMEEIDLCWRIQLAGYKIRLVPESVVWHIGGGTLPSTSPLKLKLNFRNNLLMLEKNCGKTYALREYNKANGTKSIDRIANEAARKADRCIFIRMMLDYIAAAAYLATFRYDKFKATLEAHSEYHELSRTVSADEIAAFIKTMGKVEVQGITKKSMILSRLIYGKKVFKHIYK